MSFITASQHLLFLTIKSVHKERIEGAKKCVQYFIGRSKRNSEPGSLGLGAGDIRCYLTEFGH
jgi:hypothetical protein